MKAIIHKKIGNHDVDFEIDSTDQHFGEIYKYIKWIKELVADIEAKDAAEAPEPALE